MGYVIGLVGAVTLAAFVAMGRKNRERFFKEGISFKS